MSSIPFEISDYIIDYLHDDPQALKACALACRSWVFASRFHLFRTIDLKSHELGEPFQRLLDATPELGLYVRELTVAKFFDASEAADTRSTAGTIVRPTPTSSSQEPAANPGPSPVETTLTRILAALPSLRTLTVSHTDMKSVGALGDLRLPTVASLSLSYCQFADFADVIDLIACFPALSSLALAGLTWLEEERAPLRAPGPIPTLTRLTLGRELDSERLFDWFEAAELHASVTSLTARCASEADAALVGPFLARAGDTLRELDLDWSFTGDKTIPLPECVSLAPCTALSALALRFPVHYSARLPWVPALLATLAPAARVASLACDVRLLGSLRDALDWAALAAALAADAFGALEALRFAVHLWPGVHKDIGEVDALVREGLAPFDKRGVVQVAKA